jgi:salicylate hydroxylase
MAPRKITAAPLAVGIVGAGMSGLSTAIACALGGHSVTIFEGAKELAEVGGLSVVLLNMSQTIAKWLSRLALAFKLRRTVRKY